MSCRPLAALQLLLRARTGFANRAARPPAASFSLPTQSRLPAHRQGRHFSLSCARSSNESATTESLGVVIDVNEKDTDDDFAAGAPTRDEDNVGGNGSWSFSRYLYGSVQLPTKPLDLVRAAQETETDVEEHSTHQNVDVSNMYLDTESQHELRRARHFWTHFRRMLWNEESRYLGESLLSKHRSRAIEFELQMQSGDAPLATQTTTESTPLLCVLSILIGSLAHSARLTLNALDLLESTAEVPFEVTADCLRYLRRFRQPELLSNRDLLTKFYSRLSALRNETKWPSTIRPSHLDLLLFNQNRHAARKILRNLSHNQGTKNRVGRRFLLDAFIQVQDVESALEILASFTRSELESPDIELKHRIVNLLSLETTDRSPGPGTFTLLPRLLKLGVKPDQMMHNMAIQNAIKFNLTPLAWDLVKYADEEGLELDSKTNTFLLKDSFVKQDLQHLNEIMSVIHKSKDLSQSPYIIIYMMNIIRIICYYERKASPRESLAHVLTIYDRAYNRGALIKLGILDGTHAQNSSTTLPDPPPMVIAFFIWTYVLFQRRDRIVLNLWRRFTELIEQNDPLCVDAARFAAPYNGFLLFLLRSRYSLWRAPPVLEFMLQKGLAQPADETWSICIKAFLKYRNPYHPMAAKLDSVLQQSEAKVSESTWKSYIQSSFPDYDLESEEARRFVKLEKAFDPEQPWPTFAWDRAGVLDQVLPSI